MKLSKVQPTYVDGIPATLRPGYLYISRRYRTAAHLCACGCGARVATPLKPAKWLLEDKSGLVSLRPSISRPPEQCNSHYWIRDNRIVWCRPLSGKEAASARARDQRDVQMYYTSRASAPWPVRLGRRLVSRFESFFRR
jgi:hypothetical protein